MPAIHPAVRTIGYAIGGAIFFGALVLGARAFDGRFALALPTWGIIPGLLIALLGAALAYASMARFVVSGKGTPLVTDPPREFVASGPYRLLRNPLYMAETLILGGLGLGLRSLSVLLLAPLWFLMAHCFVVFYEEPGLRRRFGRSYENYLRLVPRWLPRQPSEKR